MTSPKTSQISTVISIIVLLGFTILLVAGIRYYDQLLFKWFAWDYVKRGTFGDQFGAVSACFSGLAFLGLIITLVFQSRDLRKQTEALSLQIQESRDQKVEMARAATAQEEYNRLTKAMLWLEMEKHELQRNTVGLKPGDDFAQVRQYLAESSFSHQKMRDELARHIGPHAPD